MDNQHLAQSNHMLQETDQVAQQLVASTTARAEAVVAIREALQEQNLVLKQENGILIAQLSVLKPLLAQNDTLQTRVLQLEGQLRAPPKNSKLQTTLDKVVELANEEPRIGQKTELDDNLEQVLPALLESLKGARTDLSRLPLTGVAKRAALSADETLAQIALLLGKIPKALRLHAHWSSCFSKEVSV
jgi:hypothetical protein